MEKPAANQRLGDIATPSGKDRHSENFPVGSLLIRKNLRRHVHAYYRFARMGDDLADNPALPPQEKVDRLNRMEEVLHDPTSEAVPIVAALRRSLEVTRVDARHCSDLLIAFRLDATKQRYEDWQDLMHYCRYSASPVGRYLLELHGENRQSWAFSDALCNALQVINHLQDCKLDAQEMDRIYIPLSEFAAVQAEPADLLKPHSSPAIRRILDRLLDQTKDLLHEADRLPGKVRDFRMRAESAIIVNLAHRLVKELRERDPLAERVKLNKFKIFKAAVMGLGQALVGGHDG